MKNIKVLLPESNNDTKAMRAYVAPFVDDIQEVLGDYETILGATFVVKVRRSGEHKVELTVKTDKNTYRRETIGDDFYDIVPDVCQELEKGIYNLREKKRTIKRKNGITFKNEIKSEALEENTKDYEKVEVRLKNIDMKPMSLEDAIFNMENSGHDFYVFIHSDNKKTYTLYKRTKNSYGLIAPL